MFLVSDPRRAPFRAVMMVLAITASIALATTLFSLSSGIRDSTRVSIGSVGADIYIVPEDLNPLLIDLQRFDQGWAVMMEMEGSPLPPSVMSPRLRDSLFFRPGIGRPGETIAYGVIPDRESSFGQFDLVSGEWFENGSDPVRELFREEGRISEDAMTLEVLVSSEFSDRNGIDVGDELMLYASASNATYRTFEVKGIYVDSLSKLSGSVMVHLGELQLMKGILHRDTLTEVLLDYSDGADLGPVVEWSEGNGFSFRDLVDLYTEEQVLSELFRFTRIIDGFSAMVTSVTFVVCLAFTSAIFMISAKERSREISVLRAIGVPARRIVLFMVRESAIYYSIGLAVGLIAGHFTGLLLNTVIEERYTELPMDITPFSTDLSTIMIVSAASLLLAIISGLVPALIRVLRPPVEGLRGDIS